MSDRPESAIERARKVATWLQPQDPIKCRDGNAIEAVIDYCEALERELEQAEKLIAASQITTAIPDLVDRLEARIESLERELEALRATQDANTNDVIREEERAVEALAARDLALSRIESLESGIREALGVRDECFDSVATWAPIWDKLSDLLTHPEGEK